MPYQKHSFIIVKTLKDLEFFYLGLQVHEQ